MSSHSEEEALNVQIRDDRDRDRDRENNININNNNNNNERDGVELQVVNDGYEDESPNTQIVKPMLQQIPNAQGQTSHSTLLQPNTIIGKGKRKSLLTFDHKRIPITLAWENITYTVAMPDPNSSKKCRKPTIDKVILDNVSGCAKVGELIAIMGPSGSGKTTLINVLAGRVIEKKGSRLEGRITINGKDRSTLGSKFARLSAFVQQDDVLFNMQTVEETLLNAAKLRLPKEMPLKDKQHRVDMIITELGLEKARYTKIGDEKRRGVSGGERKRTNIGVELIQDPSLIFLDEPTSGLDSFQALNVVETLKSLCDNGCTVITSIHQPRSSIYALFDRLILLTDGYVIYDGKGGEDAVAYFAKLGYSCPSYFNPADYFLDLVSRDSRSEEESNKRIEYLIQAWKNQAHTDNERVGNPDSSMLEQLEEIKTVRSGFLTQLQVLAYRNLRQVYRDKISLMIRLFMALFFSLFLSAVYSDTNKGQKSIQDRMGILFFVTTNQSFGGMINVVNTFSVEKAIVMRERQAKSYHISAYYITKFVTAVPADAFYPIIYCSIMYWIVNLHPTVGAFFTFILITVMTTFGAMALGFFVGAFAPNIEAANAMAPPLMILMLIFGGFYINIGNIPVWLSWLENFSTIRWSYMAFCVNEFKGVKFNCGDSGDACIRTGDEVLHRMSFDNHSVWVALRNLFFLFLGLHFLAFIILRFKRTKYQDVSPIQSKPKSIQEA